MTYQPEADNRVLFLRTGGTVDAEAYADARQPPEYIKALPHEKSLIPSVMAEMPSRHELSIHTWNAVDERRFCKDSKEYTKEDIAALATFIRNDSHRCFVLAHGTDAMTENATLLQKELAGSGKTVAFCGSIVPLSMHSQTLDSDAYDYLDYAIEHSPVQSQGVYLVARASDTKRLGFFDPASVQKDRPASFRNLQFSVAYRT